MYDPSSAMEEAMKKFITQLAASALILTLGGPALADELRLAPDAPDSYSVVKGDTLWDISGRFLAEPWRWPEIWQLNRASIKDPHWIYPGDVVYLDRSGESPRLRLGKSVGDGSATRDGPGAVADGARHARNGRNAQDSSRAASGVDRRQPMVRSIPGDEDAIATINTAAIDAFLNRPLIIDEKSLNENPRIVATQEGRVYLGRGDKAYVRGITDESVTEYHIYRQARPLTDPDTRLPIAWEALYVGSARLEKAGDPATLRVYNTSEEVGVGDRLMPAERARMFNMVPRSPERDVQGRIVSVYRGVSQVGKNSVIAINRGTEDGLDVGNVLAVRQLGRVVVDRDAQESVKLPDEAVGHLLVFRVFDKIAYGLVMDASQTISVGDTVAKP